MNKVRLGDIGVFARGKSKHRPRNDKMLYEGGGFPLVQTSDIKNSLLHIIEHSQEYNSLGLKQSKLWDMGTLVITIAANIAETAILSYPMCFPDSVVGFIADKTKTSEIFIHYLLSHLRKNIQDNVQGTGSIQDNINLNFLENFEVNIPSLQTQTAIASVLSSLDDKIELNNKINLELESLAKTIYEYWFVQNADEKWEKGKLSDIANITMGQSPDGSSYNEKGDGIVFYQGCTDFGTRFPNIRQYTTEPSRYAEVGDILLSVRAPVGSLNFANTRCCIGRGLAALNSKIGSVTHLYFILKDLEMVFKRRNADGTTFGSITKDDLFSLSVTKPPKDVLIQFEKIALPIFNMQFKIAEESTQLSQLRDFLLPLLMNGQVTVGKSQEKPKIVPLNKKADNNTKFEEWKAQVELAARGNIDEQTLRNIYEAIDEKDR